MRLDSHPRRREVWLQEAGERVFPLGEDGVAIKANREKRGPALGDDHQLIAQSHPARDAVEMIGPAPA